MVYPPGWAFRLAHTNQRGPHNLTRRIKGESKTGRNFACNTRSRTKVKIEVPTHHRGVRQKQSSLLQPQRPHHFTDLISPSSAFAKYHATRPQGNIFIMAIDSEEFLHLARPIAPAAPGFNTNISPMTVNIQPQVSLPSCAPLPDIVAVQLL